MRKAKKYICDKCGKLYDTKKACLKCENHHIKPTGFYYSFGENSYPKDIMVTFENGKTLFYCLEGWANV